MWLSSAWSGRHFSTTAAAPLSAMSLAISARILSRRLRMPAISLSSSHGRNVASGWRRVNF